MLNLRLTEGTGHEGKSEFRREQEERNGKQQRDTTFQERLEKTACVNSALPRKNIHT